MVERRQADRRRWSTAKRIKALEVAVLTMGLVLIVSTVAITGVPGTGIDGLIGANKQRADESRVVAVRLAKLVSDIQGERVANTLRSCRQVNERHVRSVRRLRVQLNGLPRGVSVPTHLIALPLIATLAPKRDCRRVLAQSIPSAEVKP